MSKKRKDDLQTEIDHLKREIATLKSEKKRDQDSVRIDPKELEHRYNLILHATNDGFFEWADTEKDDQWWSDSFYRLLGYKPNEVKSTYSRFYSHIHPDDRNDVLRYIEKIIFDEKTHFDVEFRIVKKTDEIRWFRYKGKAVYNENNLPGTLAGSLEDIQLRIEYQQQLQENEQRYKTLGEASFEGIIISDGGVIVDANNRVCNLMGYTQDELKGMSATELIQPDYREIVMNNILNDYEEPYEVQALTRDGKAFYIEICGRQILYNNKKMRITVINVIDDYKKAEGELLVQRSLLHGVLNSSVDAIFAGKSIRNDSGEIIDFEVILANQAAEKLIGKPAEEIVGKKLSESHPGVVETGLLDEYINVVVNDEKLVKTQYYSFEGIDNWLRLTVVKYQDGYVAAASDITELKQQERILTDALDKYDALVYALGDLVYEYDIKENKIYWVDIFDKKSIFSNLENEKDLLMLRIHPEDREMFNSAMEHSIQNKQNIDIEFRLKSNENTFVWMQNRGTVVLDKNNSPEMLIGILRDISIRKKREMELKRLSEELRKQQLLLETLLSTTPDHLYLFDKHLTFLYASKAGAAVFGYTIEEMIGKTYKELYLPFDLLAPFLRGLKEAFQSAKSIHGELTLPSPEGGKEYEYFIIPILDEENTVTSVSATMRDVHDRIIMERSLRMYNKALEEKSQHLMRLNEELEQFTYAVSHDLKAPLRAINNYSDFLVEDVKERLNADELGYLNGLSKAVHEAIELVDDLLDLSRIGTRELKLTHLDTRKIIDSVLSQIDVPEHAILHIDDNLPLLLSDKTLLKQIFLNIITNALKFNNSDTIQITIKCHKEDDFYKFTIEDNGIGIEAKYQEQIFNVFERLHLKNEFEGTGVGLAIVKKALTILGGEILLSSEVGKGSKFIIVLPKN